MNHCAREENAPYLTRRAPAVLTYPRYALAHRERLFQFCPCLSRLGEAAEHVLAEAFIG